MIAGIISFVLYLSGIFTGLYLQKLTIEYTEEKVKDLQRRLENVQLEYMYLSTMGKEVSCDFLTLLVDETTKEVWDIGRELVNLENQRSESKQLSELEKDYSLLSVRAWILNSYVTEKCVEDKVVILYFYSVPCSDCIKQGNILDDLREKKFKDRLRVFVLNYDSDEEIVKVLKKTYNITETPSIVIGNSTYVGLIERDELSNITLKSLS